MLCFHNIIKLIQHIIACFSHQVHIFGRHIKLNKFTEISPFIRLLFVLNDKECLNSNKYRSYFSYLHCSESFLEHFLTNLMKYAFGSDLVMNIISFPKKSMTVLFRSVTGDICLEFANDVNTDPVRKAHFMWSVLPVFSTHRYITILVKAQIKYYCS